MSTYMAVCQNLVPLVNIKIAGKWMFIPLKMVLIGIDPYPYSYLEFLEHLQLSTTMVASQFHTRYHLWGLRSSSITDP